MTIDTVSDWYLNDGAMESFDHHFGHCQAVKGCEELHYVALFIVMLD